MPAHDKHTNRNTDNGKADGSNIAKIFRRQVQRIGAKTFHKDSINCTKKDKPEYKQNLVSPEMQEE